MSVGYFSYMAAFSGRLSRMVKLGVVLIVLVIPAFAQTQDGDEAQNQQSQQQNPNQKTVKQPPPPLFRRHRRGIYTDATGLLVIDATPQSPPLEIDDPGVPDKGEYEINFTTQADYSKERREVD